MNGLMLRPIFLGILLLVSSVASAKESVVVIVDNNARIESHSLFINQLTTSGTYEQKLTDLHCLLIS